jgi:hypothetical protein
LENAKLHSSKELKLHDKSSKNSVLSKKTRDVTNKLTPSRLKNDRKKTHQTGN